MTDYVTFYFQTHIKCHGIKINVDCTLQRSYLFLDGNTLIFGSHRSKTQTLRAKV